MANITALMLYEMSREYRGGDYVWTKNDGKRGRAAQVGGSHWKNPFPNGGTAYAGDLWMVDDAAKEALLLKVFKVKTATTASATEVVLYGTKFSHVPSVGDILMVAPTAVTDDGQSTKVTAVEWANDEYTITIDTALGVVAAGALLVEATGTAAAADATVLIDKVNSWVIADINCMPTPTVGGFTLLDTKVTPYRHESAIKAKMSPIPAYLETYNKAPYPETDFEL